MKYFYIGFARKFCILNENSELVFDYDDAYKYHNIVKYTYKDLTHHQITRGSKPNTEVTKKKTKYREFQEEYYNELPER